MRDLIILGAGAAGLFCAKHLQTKEYLIIEHNSKLARKLAISGGGRCNVTNKYIKAEDFFSKDPAFIRDVLRRYSNKDLLKWLKDQGCALQLKNATQYFCSKSAQQLIKLLYTPNILYDTEICDVTYDNSFVVHTSKGTFRSKALLVATGGLSYKKIGASGIGFEIAKKFGHTLYPLAPALVGLTLQKEQFWFKELSGISLPVTIAVADRRLKGNLLFAHRGISGPAVLDASLFWQRGKITVSFLERLPRLNLKKQLTTQLPLPKRFIKRFLQEIGLEDKRVALYSKKELEVIKSLCHYSFAPAGTFGYERAEVTRGGVLLSELDLNMQSNLQNGLFFAGEVCDATGRLGGYNIQWAFSSGFVAAKGIDTYLANC